MAGVLAVLVVWFVWSAFPGGGGGANAAQPKKAKTTTAAPASSPSATPPVSTSAPVVTTTKAVKPTVTVTSPAPKTPAPPATPPCAASAIKVTATADHTLYPSGVNARFVLTVTNTGTVACRLDVGTANRSFVVTSGTDRIWSSADCTKTLPNVAVFKAGDSVSYSHTWTRQRSTTGGCAAAGTGARPGTYKLIAHLGETVTGQVVFRLA